MSSRGKHRSYCVLTKAAPNFPVAPIKLQHQLKILHCPWEIFLRSQDARDSVQSLHRLVVVPQGLLVRKNRLILISLKLVRTPYFANICQRLLEYHELRASSSI